MSVVLYENHLKKAYPVESGEAFFLITATSFYSLNKETAWLIEQLPFFGTEKSFLEHLSLMGLDNPLEVSSRLISLGALKKKENHSSLHFLKCIFTPKIQLISPRIQKKLLLFFNMDLKVIMSRWGVLIVSVSMLGLLWGTFSALIGVTKAFPIALIGRPEWWQVFALAVVGSFVHELGHSLMADSADIGLRPVGLSIYLIFPVLYTNVSGIEVASFSKRLLIDCGGVIFQGLFVFALLVCALLTGKYLFAESARWIMMLVFLNLIPFLRTDGYWVYKDIQTVFKKSPFMRGIQIVYLAGFMGFSIWFLWYLGIRLIHIIENIFYVSVTPGDMLSRGYALVLWGYFLIMGGLSSFWRLREIKQEVSN